MGNNIVRCNDEELQDCLYNNDDDYTEVSKYIKIRYDDSVLNNIYGFSNNSGWQFNYMN
jgi:hypothetical protein